ncbi:MAG: hypothetical protein HY711_02510 [Candidatus Melainabacteria bacterium]|nr:hypothetical protein [Candidatus Melainabacteria bacterium]
MTRLNLTLAVLAGFTATTINSSCYANHDVSIKDGFGEEISVKKDNLGQKKTVVKDRLGDNFEQKTSSFGTKETQVNVLGNTLQRKEGWFGSSDLEATSIFGDKIISKKDKLGRRKVTVDLSGISAVLNSLFADKAPESSATPNTGSPSQSPQASNDSPTNSSEPMQKSP